MLSQSSPGTSPSAGQAKTNPSPSTLMPGVLAQSSSNTPSKVRAAAQVPATVRDNSRCASRSEACGRSSTHKDQTSDPEARSPSPKSKVWILCPVQTQDINGAAPASDLLSAPNSGSLSVRWGHTGRVLSRGVPARPIGISAPSSSVTSQTLPRS